MRQLSDIVCNRRPLTLPPSTTALDACRKMREQHVGAVLVTDERGGLIGIFTGRDAVGILAAGKDATNTPLGEVMTPNPTTMPPDKTAIDALRLMWDGGFRHIPLTQGGRIAGLVSRGDFRRDEFDRLDEERQIWECLR